MQGRKKKRQSERNLRIITATKEKNCQENEVSGLGLAGKGGWKYGPRLKTLNRDREDETAEERIKTSSG